MNIFFIIILVFILFLITLCDNLKYEKFIGNNKQINVYIFASHKYRKALRKKVSRINLQNSDIVVLSNSPNDISVWNLLNVKYKYRRVNYRIIRGPQNNDRGFFSANNYSIQNYYNYNHLGCKFYMLESNMPFDDIETKYNIEKSNLMKEENDHNILTKSARQINVGDYTSYDRNYLSVENKFYRDYCANCFYYPSAGYVSCKFMRKLYPNAKIFLVGFTFQAGPVHNMAYEKNHLSNSKNVFII